MVPLPVGGGRQPASYRRHVPGPCAGSSYTACYNPEARLLHPAAREEVKEHETHLKSRMARVAWSLGSLVALAAALGAGRKWA